MCGALVEKIGARMTIMLWPACHERGVVLEEGVCVGCICLLKDGLAEAFTMCRYADCNVF